MKKISDLFAKKIIALDEGEEVGYVLDVCFDKGLKSMIGLRVADEESEREFFLPAEEMVQMEGDCIFIQSVQATEMDFGSESYNPIGKPVFDKKGFCLGRVQDVWLDKSRVDKLLTDQCEIKQKYIAVAGRDCIVFGVRKKQSNAKPTVFTKRYSEALPKIEVQQISEPAKLNTRVSGPVKVTVTPSMILNRTATVDILGFNNELIIHQGDIITQSKINLAKKHNKLNYLIFNSK